jgi:protein transport protein SEC9
MGKFGLGKKGDGEEDSSRLALFSSRNKSKSPAPPSNNPYAQPSIPPDPYTQAKMNAGLYPPQSVPPPNPSRPSFQSDPPSQSGNPYGNMRQHGPPQASYGNMRPPGPPQMGYGEYEPPPSGYGGDNKYGPSRGTPGGVGYEAERFDRQNPYGQDSADVNPRYVAGGYGGLGRTNSNATATTDVNREELFGEARERDQRRRQNGPPDYNSADAGQEPRQEPSYGAYGDRQLTAEEEEEEDIEATKQEIKFIKQQDVSSTQNALRMAIQAEEIGRNTLARLGAQGESIHKTEQNLDIAENQAKVGEDKIKEIKSLNRSMFAVHVNNPFTATTRRERREEEILRRHQMEREQREATREAAFRSTQRMNQNFKSLSDAEARVSQPAKRSLAERAKYQFEADSEDDQMEDEIEDNLDQLSGAASRLNILAKATGAEIEQQNEHLIRISAKVCLPDTRCCLRMLTCPEQSDRFDDNLHTQTERMKRIH